MSQAPVLYDFDIGLAHVDRSLEIALSFKVARHPSETMDRLWLRVLAYCCLYEERIAFGPGLGEPDAPDLEVKDYAGQTTLWVRVGKGDPIKIQRAVDQNHAARVAVVFADSARMESFLVEARAEGAARVSKAELFAVDPSVLKELARTDERRSKLSLTIVGDHVYVDRRGVTFDGPLTRGALTQ